MMKELPLTCATCGHTSLWNTFSEGCPLCNAPKNNKEELEDGEKD